MKIEHTEVLWMDQYQKLSFTDLAKLSGLSEEVLTELVNYEAIVPIEMDAEKQTFDASCLAIAKTACRLQNDFGLDTQGLAVTLTLLARIQDLETQLHDLRMQLPRQI